MTQIQILSQAIVFGRDSQRTLLFRIERACAVRSIEVPENKARALEFYRIWATLPDGTTPSWGSLPPVLPAGSTITIAVRRCDCRFRRPIDVEVRTEVVEVAEREPESTTQSATQPNAFARRHENGLCYDPSCGRCAEEERRARVWRECQSIPQPFR